jgi:hypothetical protein
MDLSCEEAEAFAELKANVPNNANAAGWSAAMDVYRDSFVERRKTERGARPWLSLDFRKSFSTPQIMSEWLFGPSIPSAGSVRDRMLEAYWAATQS